MSKLKEVKVLTHGEVQKKIIENPPKIRPEEELLGPCNKYRDENFKIYNTKKKQFLDACKKYNRLNQEALICNRKLLLEDYREILDYEFLKEDEESKTEENIMGILLRKRTERANHQAPQQSNEPCIMEPWFRKYLKFNKFICAARKVIIRNRLLKVLEKLKTVTPEDIAVLEKRKITSLNISYAEIFEKFM